LGRPHDHQQGSDNHSSGGPQRAWGQAGDEIAYAIADGHVLLTKAGRPRRGAPFEDPFASFGEWDTPEDDEAFCDL
jgi:hypothetical protein